MTSNKGKKNPQRNYKECSGNVKFSLGRAPNFLLRVKGMVNRNNYEKKWSTLELKLKEFIKITKKNIIKKYFSNLQISNIEIIQFTSISKLSN